MQYETPRPPHARAIPPSPPPKKSPTCSGCGAASTVAARARRPSRVKAPTRLLIRACPPRRRALVCRTRRTPGRARGTPPPPPRAVRRLEASSRKSAASLPRAHPQETRWYVTDRVSNSPLSLPFECAPAPARTTGGRVLAKATSHAPARARSVPLAVMPPLHLWAEWRHVFT